MSNGYFHRVRKLTPTRFWINNPTRREAEMAIAEGATGCTLNPSYTQKMVDHPDEGSYARQVLQSVIRDVEDDTEAIAEFQRRLAAPICEKFMPIFLESHQLEGYVSIQGDPIHEHDPNVIINEAHKNLLVSPNVCIKIPTTASGLKAMETLVPEGTPINATEIFAIQQVLELGEMYEKLVPRHVKGPKLFYSHIAGIYDDQLRIDVEQNNIDIAPDLVVQAGLAVSRKAYDMVKEAGYRMEFIGGGARQLHHFTELVGGDVNLTINWVGTADELLEQNPFVVSRIFNPVPHKVIDELKSKLPNFHRGYEVGGIQVNEFEEFPPVELFRSSFLKSWNKVLGMIKTERLKI